MRWQLSRSVYWRREGDEILLANEQSILRLNSAAAALLRRLVGIDSTGESELHVAPGAIKLVEQLSSHGMLEESSDDARSGQLGREVRHMAGARS